MGKQKEKSEVEYLRGLVRQLRSENKKLKNELKRLKKKETETDELREELKDYHYEEKMHEDTCPDCQKGRLTSTHLGVKILYICSVCGHRIIKNVQKST